MRWSTHSQGAPEGGFRIGLETGRGVKGHSLQAGVRAAGRTEPERRTDMSVCQCSREIDRPRS